ncbi:hypothetical protein PsYK624_103300 [Phanerochaete sordida]|uniref:Uncharacterized protein n=1 Tax=Phanerochaete sordida TaxID=48140 RepID=A0A9P3GEE3_9APHY|nr:hypothetical protein PsYK624_103300 [Phanerochaete sordida]
MLHSLFMEMLDAKAAQREIARPGDFRIIFKSPSMYSTDEALAEKIWRQVVESPEAQSARRRGMRRGYIVSTHHTGTSPERAQHMEPDMRQHVGVVFFNFKPMSIEEVVHIEVVVT